MLTIRPVKTLFSLSALVCAGLLLQGCGNGVGVSPATAAATGTTSPPPPVNPPPPPVNPPPPPVSPPPTSPTTGSANLAWTAPTENTNGTPLTDLAGYHIYYGTTSGAWTSTITVLEPAETSYVVSGLAAGTYYFSIVAFNSAGVDSAQSNVGSKTI